MIKIISSENGRFAKRDFPFRETFAVSSARHVYTYLRISRILLATLCFQDMGPGLCWKHFLSFLLSRNCRGSFAKFYAGFPEDRYLDDMCYVKLSPNLNFPFASIVAELLRTPEYTCNVRFYINPLQGPSDCCSHMQWICLDLSLVQNLLAVRCLTELCRRSRSKFRMTETSLAVDATGDAISFHNHLVHQVFLYLPLKGRTCADSLHSTEATWPLLPPASQQRHRDQQ